jgi:DNA-binding PucR family transcriptional regulator
VLGYGLIKGSKFGLATVEKFTHCNYRLQRCADAMGIHVTTLRYRLERVRELFGIDLDDADQRFTLQLALRIRSLEALG